jgi:hypothetical protein
MMIFSEGVIDELIAVHLLIAYFSDRGHHIVASAYIDKATRKYFPVTSISWRKVDGTRGIQVISNRSESCATCVVASNLAFEMAKSWLKSNRVDIHARSEHSAK